MKQQNEVEEKKKSIMQIIPPPGIFWIITIFSPFWKRISCGSWS